MYVCYIMNIKNKLDKVLELIPDEPDSPRCAESNSIIDQIAIQPNNWLKNLSRDKKDQ